MKKIILISAMFVGMTAVAQETVSDGASTQNYDKFKSKRGVTIFPEKGEFALGVSANSFLNYFGNMLNSNGNNAPTFNNAGGSNTGSNPLSAFSGQSFGISGKYMVSESLAYRGRLNFGFGSFTTATLVQKIDPNTPSSVPSYGEDKINTRTGSVLLGLGMEKRRGKDRVKGIYGAELLLGYANTTRTFSYLNTIDLTGQQERTVMQNAGSQILVGVRPFVGIEYFFAPKISLSGELAYIAGLGIRTAGTEERERYVNGSTVETYKAPFGQSRVNAIYFGLDNFDASLNLNFYF